MRKQNSDLGKCHRLQNTAMRPSLRDNQCGPCFGSFGGARLKNLSQLENKLSLCEKIQPGLGSQSTVAPKSF